MTSIDIEALLRRDRLIVGLGLALLVLLAWAYTLWLGLGMQGGAMPVVMAMPRPGAWGAVDAALMFAMWLAMMVAMMIPSAAPLILLVALLDRKQGGAAPASRAAVFLAAYLALWALFSLAATALQWVLHDAALLDNSIGRLPAGLGAAILVVAGLYQLTPVKA
ncbi:MAG: DUF2182 domain-containing protein, partial [Dongiaceae bacterium]